MKRPDYRTLQALDAVIRERGFERAAQKLCITQSAVSQRIKQLENMFGQPLLVRYAIAALLFKFTWTFVLPFILARVAGLDNNGRLMNSINLVIGGGMAAGPALAGALLQHFASADPLLAAAGVCALLSLILIVAASAAGKA